MDEEQKERRRRWIAWSLRHQIRPLVLATIVRASGQKPPGLPLDKARCCGEITLRPSDQRLLGAPCPGHREVIEVEERARRLGFTITTPEEGGWLAWLWERLEDPPAALYVRGRLHQPGSPALAIVGTRHPTANGCQLARALARDVAAEGISIVSGMALGIDGAAHRGALDAGGHTVAVLGGGIDRPSPPSHTALANEIAEGGALVSEFPLGTEPRPLHFPRRNRIIAAMAGILLVVEGGKRSGARSTVDHALSLGCEVAAVPRDPIHEGSALPNALLRSGATPVTRAEDLLELLGPDLKGAWMRRNPVDPHLLDETETYPPLPGARDQSLLGCLGAAGRTVEEICRAVGRPSEEVFCDLGRLELAGRVRRMPGMLYVRAGGGP